MAEAATGSSAAPAATSRWMALAAGVGTLLLLFFIWPYQHWQWASESRGSVMSGWGRVVWNSANGEWTFCFIVPFLTGFLVYLKRQELLALPLQGEWTGLAIAVPALFIYWAGYKADTGYAGFLSAHLAVAALILLLGGRAWMRALFFPWLFLFFMWPMFPIEERVISKLRLITASLSGEVLHLLGINVVREGTALNSASDAARNLRQGDIFRLDVEEPCSGVRSMYSLLMVSALYGYLSLKRTTARVVLFLSAVPLAMMGNVVRMVLLALGSMWFGTEFAVGRNVGDHEEMSVYHTMCGYAVFGVALAGMFTICSVLEGSHWKAFKSVKKKSARRAVAPPEPSPAAADAGISHTRRMSVAAVAVALAGIGVCAATNVNPSIAESGVFMTLPLQFGSYQGQPHDMTAIERNNLDPGVTLVRSQYMSADRRMIEATIIQSGVGGRTLHRPEVCLPGQGWSITDRIPVPMRLPSGRVIQATALRMFHDFGTEPGVRKRVHGLNIYWYIGSDGTTSADYYDHIRIGYIDAVFKNLSHRWSMASFFLPLPDDTLGMVDPMQEATAMEELRDFAGQIAGKFMKTEGAQSRANTQKSGQ